MATFSTVQAHHIVQALAEHDSRGAQEFLSVYRFEPVAGYALVHEGRVYDPRAVLGVAHRFATGRAVAQEEFSGGMAEVVGLLRRRGFEVTEPAIPPRTPAATRAPRAPAARASSARSASSPGRAPARRPAVEDRPVALCPTCSIALPATGVCDQCG